MEPVPAFARRMRPMYRSDIAKKATIVVCSL